MVHYFVWNQTWREYDCVEWWMLQPNNNYYRHVRTYQEIRNNLMIDEEANEYGYRHTRGNRKLRYLDQRNDFKVNCKCAKSWKKISKKEKQYVKNKINSKWIHFQDDEQCELVVYKS